MTTLSAGSVRVQYTKFRDRLSHTIGLWMGDSFLPLLESIEGSGEEPWPTSPPMQQVVEERFTPGAPPVLLGVGLSGNGHWSTAVESRDSKRLMFDVACKNSKNATWLGSQYRVLVPFKTVALPQTLALESTGMQATTAESLVPATTRQAEPALSSVPRQSLGTRPKAGQSLETRDCSAIVFDLADHGGSPIEMRVLIGRLHCVDSDPRLSVLPSALPSEIRTHRWCYEVGLFEGR